MSGPEKLEDVKAGDTVRIFVGQDPGASGIVERLTNTRIVLTNGRAFNANDGYEVGGERGFIRVGKSAAIQDKWRDRRAVIDRAHVYPIHTLGPHGVTQERVQEYRAACDRAEAVLRELGEWTDTP